MNGKWQKLGRVYVARGDFNWDYSHAYIPTPVLLEKEAIRIYVSFLDREMIGRIGYVDVSSRDPMNVLCVSSLPVLDVGEPGTFDDSGVTPASIVKTNDSILLYYIGWQRHTKIRYTLFGGLAESFDVGESFKRFSQVPILERSDDELFVRSAPCVTTSNQGSKCWYIAGSEWITLNGKAVPTYNMRYIESADGRTWPRHGRVILGLNDPDEFGFGRPWIWKDGNKFRMWFSIRYKSKGYRLGYAESDDGIVWHRLPMQEGLDVSDHGWDSEMICFAAVIETEYGTYLFYNGNNYGATGFGVAELR